MKTYKNSVKIFNTVQSIINEDDVVEFEYDNNKIYFKTETYIIRIAFENSTKDSSMRFRDCSSGFEESPMLKLKDYDSSFYFNNAIKMKILLSNDEIQKIVQECLKIEQRTYIIIESIWRRNNVQR